MIRHTLALLGSACLGHWNGAFAQAPSITEYSVPTSGSSPECITSGPDGALWFTEYFGNKIGRITTEGVVSEYSVPTPTSEPYYITAGPDGALWFTESFGNKIGRITTDGVITEYSLPSAGSSPSGITAGSDGALWFTETSGVGRITIDGIVAEYPMPDVGGGITAGPDGALWLTDSSGVKRITTTGVVSEYLAPTAAQGFEPFPFAITTGPDGALWFTEDSGSSYPGGVVVPDHIARITTAGQVTEFPLSYTAGGPGVPEFITTGPDGALWFTGDYIDRITTSGVVTEYPVPTHISGLKGITVGPDGALWFTEFGGNKIGRAALTPVVSAPVNGASFASGGIVPGEIATLFGRDLTAATGINPASTLPLPVEFLKTSLLIDGSAVPLFAVDNVNGQQQINFQAPWELEGKTSATIQVVNNGVTSALLKATVVNAQPGIFFYTVSGNNFGVITHADGQLADAAHPATAGETVIIYCTGLGAVKQPQSDGVAASAADPTLTTAQVKIGGLKAAVDYSGLAPTFVGLYQVNVAVPAGVKSGSQTVVMTIAGIAGNSVLLPVQ